MVVFLIGFMGSGKSFYAKAISSILNIPVMDLDTEIEKKEAMSINQIFAEKGETHFRMLETQMLLELSKKVASDKELVMNGKGKIGLVVAVGGGTPCYNNNMDLMNKIGTTIWMAPSENVLLARLEKEKDHRPLLRDLSSSELLEFIRNKTNERAAFYGKSTFKVTDPNCTPLEIIKLVCHA